MSQQPLDFERVRGGIKDVLLAPAQLYEALRAKREGSATVCSDRPGAYRSSSVGRYKQVKELHCGKRMGKSWLDDITKTSSDKGLLRASWDVFQDVTSLGGTYQARNLRERVEQEKTRHEEILAQIKLDECLVRAHIVAIGIQLQAAAETLDRAHALLNPIGGRRKARVDVQHFDDGLARRLRMWTLNVSQASTGAFSRKPPLLGVEGQRLLAYGALSRFSAMRPPARPWRPCMELLRQALAGRGLVEDLLPLAAVGWPWGT
jgi:hypothetical protein